MSDEDEAQWVGPDTELLTLNAHQARTMPMEDLRKVFGQIIDEFINSFAMGQIANEKKELEPPFPDWLNACDPEGMTREQIVAMVEEQAFFFEHRGGHFMPLGVSEELEAEDQAASSRSFFPKPP